MKLQLYTGGMVATNAYFLEIEGTKLLIDAPAGSFDWLRQQGLQPDYLLLTHQHFDHVEDASRFECPLYAFADFSRDLTLDQRARDSGLPVNVPSFKVTKCLQEENQLELGPFHFDLLHVPGHSPDSLVYSLPEQHLALVGDTIFQHGYGRTDLPGGDEQLLFQGIRTKLLTLPDDYRLYPGHGADTNPQQERLIYAQ